MTPRVLVLAGYGLNCDYETEFAFEKSGAQAKRVHINSLISKEVSLTDFHILAFVGGFSWADDHGAGVIQAVRLKYNLGREILDFVEGGRLVIGICNGFQALVNLGLLPGLENDYTKRTVALTYNDSGNFRNAWVRVAANPKSPCVFTKGLGVVDMPIRHGEGKFFAEQDILDKLGENNQIALTYANLDGSPAQGKFPQNPNGSLLDIAGICDPTGRVFGLMPHPEAFIHPTNHPRWTFYREVQKRKGLENPPQPAIAVIKNAVDFAKQAF
jgi:phosphoribosylformylglycinamidine synthase